MPFLFLQLEDLGNDELREIASHLSSKKPGFYFLTSTANGRNMFLSIISPEFLDTVSMQNFAAWLKDEHGLRGGGAKNILQGGGEKFDAKLGEAIKAWLKSL